MKQKGDSFFIRLKNAITNFDEYKNYAEEKVSVAIKYVLKLVVLFSIVVAIALTVRLRNETNKAIQMFKEECPEFKFENNTLITEEDDKKFIRGDETNYFCIIIDGQSENLKDIEQASDYQRVIAVLKDKIVFKDSSNIETSTTFEEIGRNYDINSLSKQKVLEVFNNKNMLIVYAIFIVVSILYLFIIYLIQIIFDILLLSLVGYLFSKIIGIRFKYKSIFNMSVYSITLSFLLYMLYIIVNVFTGFEIKYFEIAYNAISYIYIITAMMMIKSDLTKEKIEVEKVIQEQRKVREENKEEEKEEEKEERKEKEKNQKENNEGNKEEGETPEGNNA